MQEAKEQFIYSNKVIEFTTVAAETCLFLERVGESSKSDFIDKSVKILPLLYLKSSLMEQQEDDESDGFLERFVTEDDYNFVKNQLSDLLGADDDFLEVFHPDMPYSDAPIVSFVSENLADIYQELKDFAANFQTESVEVMTLALAQCIDAFAEHWGQKLLNALRALHALKYGDNSGESEDNSFAFDKKDYRKLDRNSFMNYQNNED